MGVQTIDHLGYRGKRNSLTWATNVLRIWRTLLHMRRADAAYALTR